MYEELIQSLIDLAIREDIGDGDHTSLACIDKQAIGKARLVAKESGIIAGIDIAGRVLKRFDAHAVITSLLKDGDKIESGDVILNIEAHSLAILQSERLILNFMQRMSGIATQTAKYADKLKGLQTKILDTRKTSPGMRWFEKEAVRIGGGINHRFGLFDMILLKDNHIDFSGGIKSAIIKTHAYLFASNKKLDIVIEARSIEDVQEILAVGGVKRILLDNFSIQETRKAVHIIGRRFETESSGNITPENIREYGECGVDYISVGALTHHIKSIDLSLKAIV